MSLLDQLGGLFGQGDGQEGVAGSLSQLLEQQGGLSGLISKFQQGGLGEVAQSWISSGQNLPISAEQIQSVLGSDAVTSIARKLGIDPAQAADQLSGVLPQLVDGLTPGGELPADDAGIAGVLGSVKSLFG
ncbi:hypothetical protein IGB42_00826 [Andreprevotia sp. IGB-42]|uniref:YidB family protein n=1 Tax=Andreprevotia sp. IGB-42 TaxID=2497473 RepID=UPI001357D512|nr:YidB family protein [Andreprevotia sp. IGB-42]KAF0814771.1 hypothetical protein IGB42_00826 [Andreprevotia sp. IGB-42]